MANEQQYYNPAIEMMVRMAQLRQGENQQQLDRERLKAETEARQQQLKQSLQQIEYEHEHNVGSLDVQRQLAEAHANQARLDAIKTMNEMAGRGVDIGGVLRNLQSGGSINDNLSNRGPNYPVPEGVPGGGGPYAGLTPQMFTTPAQETQRIQEQARAQSYGTTQGALPAQMSLMSEEQANKMAFAQYQNAFEERIKNKEIASHEKIAGLERSTQFAIARMGRDTQLQLGGLVDVPGGGVTKTLQNLAFAAGTGQIKLNPANPIERAAFNSLLNEGWRQVDPDEIAALKQGQQLIPLFKQLEEFANKLPSTQAGAFVKGKELGVANWAGWPTDTQNDLNKIVSQALVVGRNIEGMTGGRMSVKQLELDLGALASGAIPKYQALSRLDNLKNLYTNRMENTILAGAPESQKKAIYSLPGFTSPEQLTGKPSPQQSFTHIYQDPKTGHKIGSNDGINWTDMTTNKPIIGK